MKKYFSNRFVYTICCLILVCGSMSSLAAKTTIHKESHQLRKSRVRSKQKTSQRVLSVKEQEIKLSKLMAFLNAECRTGAMLLLQMKLLLKTSQEDRAAMAAARKAMEKLRLLAKNSSIQMRRKKMQASIKVKNTPNLTAELNHINVILNHVKIIKLKLNQAKQKSGLTRRTKANVKITLQKLQTSAQQKSNRAKRILRAYKKK